MQTNTSQRQLIRESVQVTPWNASGGIMFVEYSTLRLLFAVQGREPFNGPMNGEYCIRSWQIDGNFVSTIRIHY